MIEFLIVSAFLLLIYKLMVRKIAISNITSDIKSKSIPHYYGMYITIWNIIILLASTIIANNYTQEHHYWINYLGFTIVVVISIVSILTVSANFKAREHFEKLCHAFFLLCAIFTLIISVFLISVIFVNACKFFSEISVTNFLFGSNWNPQNELDSEIQHSFGAIPIFLGTFLIMLIAISIASPLGILAATYISEYLSNGAKNIIKPLIEVLAGIPSVVYGYFATITVAPALTSIGKYFSIEISSESALAVGIVIGIMIMPYILSLTYDILKSVPKNIRDGAFALGLTQAETIFHIVLPAARSGITSAVLLASSRAIGETMIVAMAAGLNANLTVNPLQSVTTFTVQIVAILTGDQDFHSIKTNAAFALALLLFIITLILNVISQLILKKTRYRYD